MRNCGHLGHEYKDHGNGLHPPQALFFKDLRAAWSMRAGGRPARGRGNGRGIGRNSGPSGRGGGGFSEPPPYQSSRKEDEQMDEDDPDNSQKRAANSQLSTSETGLQGADARALVPVDKSGKVGAMVNQFKTSPPSPNPMRDPKRMKADEIEGSTENKNNGALAGSREEHHQV